MSFTDDAKIWVHNKANEVRGLVNYVSQEEAEAIMEFAECEAENQINCNQIKCADFTAWDSVVRSAHILKLGAKQVVSITAQKVSDWTKKE